MTTLPQWLRLLATLLIIKVVIAVLFSYCDYLPPNFETGFLLERESHFFGSYEWAFYAHVTSGAINDNKFTTKLTMKKRRIDFTDIYPSGPHYSRGVRAGNMLFLSGCTANGSPAQNGTPMEQLRVILDRLTRMVKAEGGQPSDICKLTMFVADPHKWHPFEGEQIAIYHEFFGDDYPVNTLVGVTFPMDSIHIEIDAIAVLD